MEIIGRRKEKETLAAILQSQKPEFVVVYGRRRIGKTYLIGEYFGNTFAFRAAGLSKGGMREQLAVFENSLRDSGLSIDGSPKNWLEAFSLLKEVLSLKSVVRHSETGKIVCFIDELPWFDTPKSGFKTALEHFWNSWGCTQEDLVLIVCGSSTSWLVNNLLSSTEGFYDRVTRVIDLQSFTLAECKSFFDWKGGGYSKRQILESYMVFGGVPYYLDLQAQNQSLAQNVDELLFSRGGQLVPEFDRLYTTLFRNPEPYIAVVEALAKKKSGLTRNELSSLLGLEGGKLSRVLGNLDLCGFIRGFRDFTKKKNGKIYQLIDPFTLFYLTFVQSGRIDSWLSFVGTPAYYSWAGLAFETLCLLHVDEIKRSLGVSGVQTSVCGWKSAASMPGAQIDLLIERRDDVVNLCEMKYFANEYAMTAEDERSMQNKIAAFRAEVTTKKAIHPTLVTFNGALHNEHFNSIILSEVCVADWLED